MNNLFLIHKKTLRKATLFLYQLPQLCRLTLKTTVLCTLLLLASCTPAVSANMPDTQSTATINPAFQTTLTPYPKAPTYRCGAWASNNAPGTYSTITVYARLTRDIAPVIGAPATATVHFKYAGDATLDQQPSSDSGGYVTFTVQLQGRQPAKQPATIDVAFRISGQHIQCTPAFFTPQ